MPTAYIEGMPDEKEYERTCQRCGTVWYVSPRDLKLDRAEMMLRGVGLGNHRRRARDVRDLRREHDERVRTLGRCPGCNSSQYTETIS
jgi:hypothetical protein